MSITVAVPTAHRSAYELVGRECDFIVCLPISHAHRFALAEAYLDFPDLTDSEVIRCLQ